MDPIHDAMLRQIDPTYLILVQYLASVNPNATIRVLLPKGAEGTSKDAKAYKKTEKTGQPKSVNEHVEKEVTTPVQESVKKEVPKEVVPSNSSILKRK